jgi:hypothetical protein
LKVLTDIARSMFRQQKKKHRAECRSPVIKPVIVSKRKPVRNGQKKKMSVLAQKSHHKTDNDVYKALSKDFSEDKILYRADGLKTIETVHVINRLNEVLGILGWSFRHSTPTSNGKEYTCNGRLNVHINGKSTFRQQTGSCKYDIANGTTLSKGEAQTGAIQMALKKCASLYGIGLDQIYRSNR